MTQDRIESERTQALRGLPSVDELLRAPGLDDVPRPLLVREARRMLEDLRRDVLAGKIGADSLPALCGNGASPEELLARCRRAATPRHRPVINGTGVVLHTGIGRAPLAPAASRAAAGVGGYGIVEVDPNTGERDQREIGVAGLLEDILGVSGALVVNNNAAAITLALYALVRGREAVVSRGEQVEIGGGFRMPDVMAQAGCIMVEVGSTNRTHLSDYQGALTGDTGCLLKVHPSNYRIEGFHSMPAMAELVALAERHGTLVIEDLGSGFLLDPSLAIDGLADEPRVQQSIADGVHLITFSGDKLLGGPQCGIVVGDRELVAQVRAHPMYRTFRCDKMALAALEATLRIYRDGNPLEEIPTLRMLAAGPEQLEARANDLAGRLSDLVPTVVASRSYAGSGANPARSLDSFAVALPGGDALCARLRTGPAGGIFARIEEDRVLLDQRTLLLEDLDDLAARIRANAAGTAGS